jgi:hypothetical protein
VALSSTCQVFSFLGHMMNSMNRATLGPSLTLLVSDGRLLKLHGPPVAWRCCQLNTDGKEVTGFCSDTLTLSARYLTRVIPGTCR